MAAEDFATEAQIKKLYAVLHSLNIGPKEFKKAHKFDSYAKLTRGQCSEYIGALEPSNTQKKFGNEERAQQQQKQKQPGWLTDPGVSPAAEETKRHAELGTDETMLSIIEDMRTAVKGAVQITLQEVLTAELPIQGVGNFVEKIAVTIFRHKHGGAILREPETEPASGGD